MGANRALVDVVSEREDIALAVADMIGTLDHAPPASDAEIRSLIGDAPLATTLDIQGRAHDIYGDPATYMVGGTRLFDPPATEAERDAMFAARRAIVRAWPRAYLAHRWRQFRGVLGLTSAPWWPIQTAFTPNPRERWTLQYAASHSLVQRTLIQPVHWLANHVTLPFRAHLYFLLAIVLLPLAAARRHRHAIALLASGLVYELALFFVANRIEYRDSHWLVAATTLAVVLQIARQRAKR
jgi:hypothetical protein